MNARLAPHELAEADREHAEYEARFNDIWDQPGLFSVGHPDLAQAFCDEVMLIVSEWDNKMDSQSACLNIGSRVRALRERYVDRAARW